MYEKIRALFRPKPQSITVDGATITLDENSAQLLGRDQKVIPTLASECLRAQRVFSAHIEKANELHAMLSSGQYTLSSVNATSVEAHRLSEYALYGLRTLNPKRIEQEVNNCEQRLQSAIRVCAAHKGIAAQSALEEIRGKLLFRAAEMKRTQNALHRAANALHEKVDQTRAILAVIGAQAPSKT